MEIVIKHLYPAATPALNDIVIADIQSIKETAVYAHLPAYGNLEVMLPCSEINVRKHKRVSDYIHVGDLVPVQVIRMQDGMIDVSLKAIASAEKAPALEEYHRRLRIDQVLRTAASYDPAILRTMYEAEVWPFSLEEVWTRFEEIRSTALEDTPLHRAIQQRFPLATYTSEKEILIRFGLEPTGTATLSAELRRLAVMEGITVIVVAPPRYRLSATAPTAARATLLLTAAISSVITPK
jgi:translation initiation factor 2 alpha subunit (eIF-2alpha)